MQELQRKRAQLDADIARAQAGEVPLLDDTSIKERFLQFQQLARELLADFREVEHNFRQLDRSVREKIALWDGSKGELLDSIMGERDAIADSDQGRSFRAFWDFLMSSSRQEALSEHLERALALPQVIELKPEPRTRRMHHDWLEAGEHTQRTVAQLSQQLRRFLDDRVFQENRRILDLLRGIESKALALRQTALRGDVMQIDGIGADIALPLERPLFSPKARLRLEQLLPEQGDDDIDTARLFEQIVVDKARLSANIRQALRGSSQVSLHALVEEMPLRNGLAELVAYLELAHAGSGSLQDVRATVDESVQDTIRWQAHDAAGQPVQREARLPRVIFLR